MNVSLLEVGTEVSVVSIIFHKALMVAVTNNPALYTGHLWLGLVAEVALDIHIGSQVCNTCIVKFIVERKVVKSYNLHTIGLSIGSF